MQPGAGSVGAAATAGGGAESIFAVAGIVDVVGTANLIPGAAFGNALLAKNSDHIVVSVAWQQPAVSAALSEIIVTVQ